MILVLVFIITILAVPEALVVAVVQVALVLILVLAEPEVAAAVVEPVAHLMVLAADMFISAVTEVEEVFLQAWLVRKILKPANLLLPAVQVVRPELVASL